MNWIVAFTTPIFLAHSSFGIYFLFGSASLLVAAVCIFLPETRGRSLEFIDESFRKGVPAPNIELLELGDMNAHEETTQTKGNGMIVNARASSSME